MPGKSFENPLLSHARMRGIYRGLVESRALKLVPRGCEAGFVAALIDLHEGDFSLSTLGPRAPAYLRQLGARTGSANPTLAGMRALLEQPEQRFPGTASDALLCAAGAAMAFKSAAAHVQDPAISLTLLGAKGQTAKGQTAKGETEASWIQTLRTTQAADLPLIVVSLPLSSAPDWQAVGKRAAIPVIPVDASDAVAIYRVAQESIVRARADRRGAVIECVPSKQDPVTLMAEQLLAKRIATRRWINAVAEQFTAAVIQAQKQHTGTSGPGSSITRSPRRSS